MLAYIFNFSKQTKDKFTLLFTSMYVVTSESNICQFIYPV